MRSQPLPKSSVQERRASIKLQPTPIWNHANEPPDGRLHAESSNNPITRKSIELDCIHEEESLSRDSSQSFTGLQISHNADSGLPSGNSRKLEHLEPHNPGKRTLPKILPSLHDSRRRSTIATRTNSAGYSQVTLKWYEKSVLDQRRWKFKNSRKRNIRHRVIKTAIESKEDGCKADRTVPNPQQLLATMNEPLEESGAADIATSPADDLSASPLPLQDNPSRKNSWSPQGQNHSDSGISVQSSSPDSYRSDDQEENDSDSSIEDEDNTPFRPPVGGWDSDTTLLRHRHHPNKNALPDTDPMVQRLRDQEEELHQHIHLHSPQPLRFARPAITAAYEPAPSWNPYNPHFVNALPTGYLYPPYTHDSYSPDPQSPTENQAMQLPALDPIVDGYELIASKLSEDYNPGSKDSIRPLYRKFEHLNHRILLHLQDEISELEEDLRQLDQAIALANVDSAKQRRSLQSRRNEAQFGNELHHRRTELLGKVFVKLGQYNKALKSYRNAFGVSLSAPRTREPFQRAEPCDIEIYRNWMKRNAPLDQSEARFLDNTTDLISLPKHSCSRPTLSSVFWNSTTQQGLCLAGGLMM